MSGLIGLMLYVFVGCATAGLAARRWPRRSEFDDVSYVWIVAGVFWPVAILVVGPGMWLFGKARGAAPESRERRR